jgi:hypothetical protein
MKWFSAMSTNHGGGVGVKVPLIINAVVANSWKALDMVEAKAAKTAAKTARSATPTDRADRIPLSRRMT